MPLTFLSPSLADLDLPPLFLLLNKLAGSMALSTCHSYSLHVVANTKDYESEFCDKKFIFALHYT